MNVLLSSNKLERKGELQKMLMHSSVIYKLNSQIEESTQMEIMLSNIEQVLKRPHKEMIMDFNERKFLKCCDTILDALELIHGEYNDKKTFIYSSPGILNID